MRVLKIAVLVLFPALSFASENTLMVNSECVDEKAHGPYQVKTQSGLIRIDGQYENGNRSGDFTFYDAAGQKMIVVPYHKGFIHGTVTAWHRDAAGGNAEPQLKLLSDIEGGFAVGRYQTWYENGEQRSRFELGNGEIKSGTVWNTDGSVIEIKAQAEFLSTDIESDFSYYQQLEQVLDAFPPQC
jgi:hypothetical protein